MKHYGDITKINGADVEPVDVITGGSPCQDLSVAGKRAGLDGERSGLFMEQIRIIKEMRERDVRTGRTNEFIRPRWMVWENVPGAFSSNGGEDFRIVLEETARIVDQTATIPRPKDGKWSNSGCIMGNGWSIAWRVHDAQFWGVPQRRRRIALVADFGGQSAPEILFERKSLSGDSEESEGTRERTAKSFGTCAKKSSIRTLNQLGFQTEASPTVTTSESEAVLLESNQNHATIRTDGISTALPASAGMGGGYVPMVCMNDQGVSRDFEQGRTQRKEATRSVGTGTKESDEYFINEPVQGLVVENDFYNCKAGLSHESPVEDSFCADSNGLQRPSDNYNLEWGAANEQS